MGLRRSRGWLGLALAFGLPLTVGCQTHLGGMTLPSPHYLTDLPDFIPRAPNFPLPRELARQQEIAANAFGGGALPPEEILPPGAGVPPGAP